MAKDPRDQVLEELVQYMGEMLVEAEKALTYYKQSPHEDEPRSELHQKIYLMEKSQIIHEKSHRVCGIAAQHPLNDLGRNQCQSEISRLKDILKDYKRFQGNLV